MNEPSSEVVPRVVTPIVVAPIVVAPIVAAPIIDRDRARMASVIAFGDRSLKVFTADEILKVIGFAVSSAHAKGID